MLEKLGGDTNPRQEGPGLSFGRKNVNCTCFTNGCSLEASLRKDRKKENGCWIGNMENEKPASPLADRRDGVL
jgi:hypothetical protein